MGVMVNARKNDYWATRHVLGLQCKKVSKSYLDVLLKRMMEDGLVYREKTELGRKKVWGYKATELGQQWWSDPSVRGRQPRSTQELEVALLPLEETIERDGWVERWNDQVLHINAFVGKMIRKHMTGQRKGDRAKQRKYDCAAFHALTSYSKTKGYTLRLRFRLEPWRDHLANWFGLCGIPLDAVEAIIGEIEKQLPGSFKQQEHRVIGAFGTAVRKVEGRFKIKSTDLESGRKGITEMEYSRRGEFQFSGDGQMVDHLATALAAYQHNQVINLARESGERERIERLILLLAQGKTDEVQRMLGVEPEEDEEKGVDYFV
jgi:hypothetical protein